MHKKFFAVLFHSFVRGLFRIIDLDFCVALMTTSKDSKVSKDVDSKSTLMRLNELLSVLYASFFQSRLKLLTSFG